MNEEGPEQPVLLSRPHDKTPSPMLSLPGTGVGFAVSVAPAMDVQHVAPAPRWVWACAHSLLEKSAAVRKSQGLLRWSIADIQVWHFGPKIEQYLNQSQWSWRRLRNSFSTLGGKGCSGEDAFGLVMLAYCAYVGRTYADAGEIWPAVRERLTEPIRSTLFRKRHYPVPELRSAIRSAAMKFGLRNTFDNAEPQQAFMRTFQLQFGLSWNRETISEYQPPVIVAELTSPNGANYSPEFHQLWETLLKFRHRLISEQILMERTRENRWLPEGGVESLLAWARPQQTKEDRNQTQVFLRPRITANAQVRLHLSTKLSDRLTDDRYSVYIQNGNTSRSYDLVRQGESFRLLLAGAHQSHVELPASDPIITVRVSQSGRELFEEVIDVRPVNGLFAVYSSGGVEQDEDNPIDRTGRYTILHAADVHVRPEYTWFVAFGNRWRITFASGPFSAEFGLFAGSERIWPTDQLSTARSASRWTTVVSAGDSVWGATTEIQIKRYPADLEPIMLTIGGVDFSITIRDTAEGVKHVCKVPVNPQLLHAEAVAFLRCWGNGKAHSLRCFLLPGKHSGHLIERDGRWEALHLYHCDRSWTEGCA